MILCFCFGIGQQSKHSIEQSLWDHQPRQLFPLKKKKKRKAISLRYLSQQQERCGWHSPSSALKTETPKREESCPSSHSSWWQTWVFYMAVWSQDIQPNVLLTLLSVCRRSLRCCGCLHEQWCSSLCESCQSWGIDLEVVILLSVPRDSESRRKVKHCPWIFHAYVSAHCEVAIQF